MGKDIRLVSQTTKCLHCERPVAYANGRGFVHLPEGRAFVMQHEIKSEREIAHYLRDYHEKRSKGCGWIGVQPVDTITWDTDICPQCGAQGELADHHIASPSHEKQASDRSGICSAPEKCQQADQIKCECACGGANHGTQIAMFL